MIAAPSPFVRPLSPRQQDILDLRLAGLTNRDVAAALWLSQGTVELELARIRGCAGLEGDYPRTWLVVLARRYTAWQCGRGGE